MGQLKQEELFKENDFPKKVYDLPDYTSVYERTGSVLSYRRRISVAEKDLCLNLDTKMLEKPSRLTKDLKRFLEGTLIAAFFLHGFFVAIIILGVSLETCIQKSLSKALQGEDNSRVWILLYFIGTFMEYIDFIVMFAATVYFRAKMLGVQDYLNELAEEGCFLDLQDQSAVGDFQSVVDVVVGNFFKYSLSIFLIGSFAIFSCGYLLWKLR